MNSYRESRCLTQDREQCIEQTLSTGMCGNVLHASGFAEPLDSVLEGFGGVIAMGDRLLDDADGRGGLVALMKGTVFSAGRS